MFWVVCMLPHLVHNIAKHCNVLSFTICVCQSWYASTIVTSFWQQVDIVPAIFRQSVHSS
jgi:hypothetical protein